MKTYDIPVYIEVPAKEVEYLLSCAFEGGSNYWVDSIEIYEWPEGCTFASEAIAMGCSFAVHIDGEDEPHRFLDSEGQVQRALQLLVEKYSEYWTDFVNENYDADTGDVFFQLLCFGEIVYG